jgi:hypothetical protein
MPDRIEPSVNQSVLVGQRPSPIPTALPLLIPHH